MKQPAELRGRDLLEALDWLALWPSERKKRPTPNLTPLSDQEKRIILLALRLHERGVYVGRLLAREEKADAVMPRPILSVGRLDWREEGKYRLATNVSVAAFLARLAKIPGALHSERFRSELLMQLQWMPWEEARKVFLALWRTEHNTDKKRVRTRHVLEVFARMRRECAGGTPKGKAVTAEAERRRVPPSTVLGELRDAARIAGERVQRPHYRPKRRRTD